MSVWWLGLWESLAVGIGAAAVGEGESALQAEGSPMAASVWLFSIWPRLPSGWKSRPVAVVLPPEAGQLRPHGDGHISSCKEMLHSSATAVLLTSWESRFRSTLFGVINLSLIKGCQLGRMLSQYNDLLLLHKCQVKAGTYFQSRRHLSCDSVVLKWLTPAAPNDGCKLSGAGAADWKVPPAQPVFLQHGRGVGTQRGGSSALSGGCCFLKGENKFYDSHPPPTAAVSKQILFCQVLASLGLLNLTEKSLRKKFIRLDLYLFCTQTLLLCSPVAVMSGTNFCLRAKHVPSYWTLFT